MSVDECIEKYPEMAKNIFGKSRVSLRGLINDKYDHNNLQREIQKIVNGRLPQQTSRDFKDFRAYNSPDDLCRT
jgi:hypothetical protein